MDCVQPSRQTYRSGCRCRGCRAANTRSELARRRKVEAGRPRWAARVPAGETWRKLRALVAEYGTLANVARELHLSNDHVHFRGRATISLKNYAKVARLFHQVHEA